MSLQPSQSLGGTLLEEGSLCGIDIVTFGNPETDVDTRPHCFVGNDLVDIGKGLNGIINKLSLFVRYSLLSFNLVWVCL